VELAKLEAEQAAARRRLEDAGADAAEGDDREALAERLVRLERRRETFAAVQQHFADVAQTLFPGGEGRLRLSEPDEDGADDGSEPGVEIELRPVGKRVTKLSLLSG